MSAVFWSAWSDSQELKRAGYRVLLLNRWLENTKTLVVGGFIARFWLGDIHFEVRLWYNSP